MQIASFAAALFLSLATLAASASASVISFSTRAYTGGALGSAAAYNSTIYTLMAQAPTAGYGGCGKRSTPTSAGRGPWAIWPAGPASAASSCAGCASATSEPARSCT